MLVLIVITIGWYRIKKFTAFQAGSLPDVSVIIAVRNERKNILNTLSDLILQDYPTDQFEILIVNDHSEDGTVKLVQTFIDQNKNIRIRLIDSSGIGKKEAIEEGVNNSDNELIVTTDGDCNPGSHWLRHMVAHQQHKGVKMVVGPVVYFEKKGVLQKFFLLEFISLAASGAGSLGMGLPLMANGANMLFAKQTYKSVINEQAGSSFASGDDVFLLHAITKKFGTSSVSFIKDPLSIVFTESPGNVKSFLSQRKRWASKAKAYRTWWPIIVSLIVFGTNLMLVLSFFTIVLRPWFLLIFILFVLLKSLIELPLLYSFAEFSNRKSTVPYLFIFGFLYPFYIVFAGISSFCFGFSWKGRNNVK
jgi:cellulose synthase/poly-beta-1,6-N-acetylglucosamine synthase-like glycosyltransferase